MSEIVLTFPLARNFCPEDLGPIVYQRDTRGPGTVRRSE
jgi:hypothetical protein